MFRIFCSSLIGSAGLNSTSPAGETVPERTSELLIPFTALVQFPRVWSLVIHHATGNGVGSLPEEIGYVVERQGNSTKERLLLWPGLWRKTLARQTD